MANNHISSIKSLLNCKRPIFKVASNGILPLNISYSISFYNPIIPTPHTIFSLIT